ncbi:RDD family protein [Corallincola spongiicola]|uniref:RDD family protein n=1 Tax=Corallincola spongiicola TaxID=2520508 RepID=A0ABY1WNF6_9GAMM|nr:RDD family protein [Corallincola spongiicola]TAA45099.1 RDD family protein [Corallincola spongiicola]
MKEAATDVTQEAKQRAEDRRIITPYAFHIPFEVLGMPLAAPWRRALALTIDLIVIALLSTLNGYLMGVILGWIFWRMLSDSPFSSVTRKLLKTLATLVILVSSIAGIISFFDEENGQVNEVTTSLQNISSVVTLARVVSCDTGACWQPHLQQTAHFIASQTTNEAAAKKLISQLLEDSPLSTEEQKLISHQLLTLALPLQGSMTNQPDVTEKEKSAVATKTGGKKEEQLESEDPIVIAPFAEEATLTAQGPLAWLRALLEELGLGFGWAACYFTLFTAWWNGQTPGKRALRIRVLQLDNTPISLWDAFGRYGGYGAGLATGLLGFIQIFWDPNRQAIQDKISTTVVIATHQSKKITASTEVADES